MTLQVRSRFGVAVYAVVAAAAVGGVAYAVDQTTEKPREIRIEAAATRVNIMHIKVSLKVAGEPKPRIERYGVFTSPRTWVEVVPKDAVVATSITVDIDWVGTRSALSCSIWDGDRRVDHDDTQVAASTDRHLVECSHMG